MPRLCLCRVRRLSFLKASPVRYVVWLAVRVISTGSRKICVTFDCCVGLVLTPTETGLYRFTLAEAGVATLKIAGQTFGPAYREATQFLIGPHYVLQGTVRLTAGQPVPVEIDYSSISGLFGKVSTKVGGVTVP